MRRYVIVGSGIAGLCAAEAIRAHEAEPSSIVMISEESHDFYSRPGLAYLLRGDVPEKQLVVRTRDDLRALQVTRLHMRVDKIDCQARSVTLADRQVVPYDCLLLATGALAVPPTFPGGNLVGVVKLDGLDDTRHILRLARRGKTAVVVGGGITALELAEGLNARGMKVHYFLRGDRYWADVLDEAESQIIMDRLRHEGVVLHLNTQVKQAHGVKGKLTTVETLAGETLPCHVLANAIGVRPRVDLAKQAGLTVDKGIVVNPFLQTSQPEVYAAGDCAQVGQTPLDVLWPTAIDQGRVAGANMAGVKQAYVKGVACNVTMLTGLKVTIIGSVGRKKDQKKDADLVSIARGDSEAWRLLANAFVLADQDAVNRVRLFIGEKKIVGALVMGEQSWSRPLQHLIAAEADITPIRAALVSESGSGLTALANFYQQWQAPG